jgi:error-prone DNA polymerase
MPEQPNEKLYTGAAIDPPNRLIESEYAYAELDVTSNYSFLRGASHPDELVYTAALLGYRAMAITDVNSVAGIVRAHEAAKKVHGFQLIIGARLVFIDGTPDVLAWPTDIDAYGRLCQLLSLGKRRAPKGECHLLLADLLERGDGLHLGIVVPPCADMLSDAFESTATTLRDRFADRVSVAVSFCFDGNDDSRLTRLADLCGHIGVPLLATNHVHYHDPGRRALQDVLNCTRHGVTLEEAGHRLFPNAERYLKSPEQMTRLFYDYPDAIRRGLIVAAQCKFNLSELDYIYPDDVTPPGHDPSQYLRALTLAGASRRYPRGVPYKVLRLLVKEFKLINRSKYEPYFLTVYDIVRFARSRGILCQGRGSAANSAVCFCLGITSVDPNEFTLVFARFINAARKEPPDIDVDFEHERREEVIQYVYDKYGRDRAGMTGSLITYRGRSAIRDVGKALGLSEDVLDTMAGKLDWWHKGVLSDAQLAEAGLSGADSTIRHLLALASELLGFPRHLSQHVGGLVISRGPLANIVPIENASMEDRTVIEWDKDDLDTVNIFKIDILALGMLTAISKCLGMVGGRHEGTQARRHEVAEAATTQNKPQEINPPVATTFELSESIPAECDQPRQSRHSGSDRRVKTSTPSRVPIELTLPQASPEQFADDEGTPSDFVAHTPLQYSTEQRRPHDASDWSDQNALFQETAASPHRLTSSKPLPSARRLSLGASESSPQCTSLPSARLPHSPSCLRASVPSCLSPPIDLSSIPWNDPAVFDMICAADTVGVFQIESRAQMSMLPRLQPRCFYDLVVEVAIVRPGPIQGDMVHPYLQRREAKRKDPNFKVDYPKPELEAVLKDTLGIPLFQEQAMNMSIVAAGFSEAEADELRRGMAAWKRSEGLGRFHDKFIAGMLKNGYEPDFAERCFEQIKGFGSYGFPESHAASFARLVYVSAWLKHYHPAAFCASIINSYPMGFYAPAQLVIDAQKHGVDVRPVDVNESEWDCCLEGSDGATEGNANQTLAVSIAVPPSSSLRGSVAPSLSLPPSLSPPLRLGFRLIKGMKQADAERIVAERLANGPFESVEQFHRRTKLSGAVVRRLAEADAFGSIDLSRRQANWHALAIGTDDTPIIDVTRCADEQLPLFLPEMSAPDEVLTDYTTLGLSLKAHPLSFLRAELSKQRVITARDLKDAARYPHGKWVKVAGLVLVRQRPGTASGVVFITIEDETGTANLIVWSHVYERYRPAARHATLMLVEGCVQREGQVIHVLAKRIHDRSDLITGLSQHSRNFH